MYDLLLLQHTADRPDYRGHLLDMMQPSIRVALKEPELGFFSHICALFCLHLEGGIIQQPFQELFSFREIGTKYILSVLHTKYWQLGVLS